jgi:hypothetical protein
MNKILIIALLNSATQIQYTGHLKWNCSLRWGGGGGGAENPMQASCRGGGGGELQRLLLCLLLE